MMKAQKQPPLSAENVIQTVTMKTLMKTMVRTELMSPQFAWEIQDSTGAVASFTTTATIVMHLGVVLETTEIRIVNAVMITTMPELVVCFPVRGVVEAILKNIPVVMI